MKKIAFAAILLAITLPMRCPTTEIAGIFGSDHEG